MNMWLQRWLARGGSFTDLLGPMWFRRWLARGDSNALAGEASFRVWVRNNTSIS